MSVMSAREIAAALGVTLGRAYKIARELRWPFVDTNDPACPYHWDVPEITAELIARTRPAGGNYGKVKIPGFAAEFCRHGFPVPARSGRACPRCVAVSDSMVAVALDEPRLELPAGVPSWVFQ